MENKYYNIRVRNRRDNTDYLVMQHVSGYLVDSYVASRQLLADEGEEVYKEQIKD